MKTYRIYFNRRGAPKDQAWSVDTGEGTRRRQFREVRFDGEARTIYNGKQPDWENPIGWIEIQGQMKVTGKMAEIFED